MRVLTMTKIREVLRQRHELDRSYREISRSINVALSTVGEYLRRAKAAGLGWPLPEELSEAQLYKRLYLPSQSPAKQKPQPKWAQVHTELSKAGVTLLHCGESIVKTMPMA